MIDISAVFVEYAGGPFPSFTGKNATGAGATDGTEFIKALIDNWMWGPSQALLDYCGLSPNGVTEAAGASQILDALNMIGVPVGTVIEWNRKNDPATDGYRFLPLNGQGILRANYADLDSAVYVGDANNAAVAAAGGGYYHADNSDGTSPNTAGIYLILPESRGYTVRGLDTAASVDPDGASRKLGDIQDDAMQRITGKVGINDNNYANLFISGAFTIDPSAPPSGAAQFTNISYSPPTTNPNGSFDFDSSGSTSPNTAKTDDDETRMANRSTQFVIRY